MKKMKIVTRNGYKVSSCWLSSSDGEQKLLLFVYVQYNRQFICVILESFSHWQIAQPMFSADRQDYFNAESLSTQKVYIVTVYSYKFLSCRNIQWLDSFSKKI